MKREDGSRQIAITAEIEANITSVGKVVSAVKRDGISDIAKRYGLEFYFAGKVEEQEETFADMRLGFFIGL